jgi:hypothetical protein
MNHWLRYIYQAQDFDSEKMNNLVETRFNDLDYVHMYGITAERFENGAEKSQLVN